MPDTLTPEMREGLPEPEGYRVNSLPDENDIVFLLGKRAQPSRHVTEHRFLGRRERAELGLRPVRDRQR